MPEDIISKKKVSPKNISTKSSLYVGDLVDVPLTKTIIKPNTCSTPPRTISGSEIHFKHGF
jgi:hypothetical protein